MILLDAERVGAYDSSTYRQGGVVPTCHPRNRDIPGPIPFFSRADFKHDSGLTAEVARRSNDDLTDGQGGG